MLGDTARPNEYAVSKTVVAMNSELAMLLRLKNRLAPRAPTASPVPDTAKPQAVSSVQQRIRRRAS
jgi:hypothetical protein